MDEEDIEKMTNEMISNLEGAPEHEDAFSTYMNEVERKKASAIAERFIKAEREGGHNNKGGSKNERFQRYLEMRRREEEDQAGTDETNEFDGVKDFEPQDELELLQRYKVVTSSEHTTERKIELHRLRGNRGTVKGAIESTAKNKRRSTNLKKICRMH